MQKVYTLRKTYTYAEVYHRIFVLQRSVHGSL